MCWRGAGADHLISMLHVLTFPYRWPVTCGEILLYNECGWIIRITHTSAAVLHQPLIQPVSWQPAGFDKTERKQSVGSVKVKHDVFHMEISSSMASPLFSSPLPLNYQSP